MTANRCTSTDDSAPPERRFPGNRPAGRRPTAEPAPKPRKTEADAEMSALGAEPAAFPLEHALRKTADNRRPWKSAPFLPDTSYPRDARFAAAKIEL